MSAITDGLTMAELKKQGATLYAELVWLQIAASVAEDCDRQAAMEELMAESEAKTAQLADIDRQLLQRGARPFLAVC